MSNSVVIAVQELFTASLNALHFLEDDVCHLQQAEKFMEHIPSSICDDVTLSKWNDSSTYCQYFKWEAPSSTLNGFHSDSFLIDHIDKLHHFVVPLSQSSGIKKWDFFQLSSAHVSLSSAKKLLLCTPPLHPKSQHRSRMWAQTSQGPHHRF